jgi:hypothetical protein
MALNKDEDYFLPLEDQRFFGAGIKRKRVQFIHSTTAVLNTTTQAVRSDSESLTYQTTEPLRSSVADKYLAIVLPQEAKSPIPQPEGVADGDLSTPTAELKSSPVLSPNMMPFSTKIDSGHQQQKHTAAQLCEVCDLPIDINPLSSDNNASLKMAKAHEASIAHQVCLTHSHPPSHLDRTRHGLRYLVAHGWDPDSRLGLGVRGREGIREPLKTKIKDNTVGLGMVIEPSCKATKRTMKLNAKQVRRGDLEARRRGERLRGIFYHRDDVQQYLGDGG